MKHRSIIGFILVAAALFAAPQIAHDLLSLKSALGERIRGEIVHAILSVSKGDGSEVLTARRTSATPEAGAKVCQQAQAAPKPNKSEVRTPADARPAAQSQQGDNQLAMLVSPSLLIEGAGEETWDAGGFDQNIVVHSPGLPRETPAQVEVAALAPRDAVAPPVPAPAPAVARSIYQSERSRGRESRDWAEAQQQLAHFAVDLQTRKVDTQAAGVEILRRFGAAIPASYEFRVEGAGAAPRVRFVRVRRCGGKDKSVSFSYTQKAARQVAKCATEIAAPQPPPAE
jgi:hypothetical protein